MLAKFISLLLCLLLIFQCGYFSGKAYIYIYVDDMNHTFKKVFFQYFEILLKT